MNDGWLQKFINHVERKPFNIIRFDEEAWEALKQSRLGVSEFTFARSHHSLNGLSKNSVCILSGTYEGAQELYIGLVQSKSAVTTLESRVKISRCSKLSTSNEQALQAISTNKVHSGNLKRRLATRKQEISLSSKLSSHLVEELAKEESNLLVFQRFHAAINRPRVFGKNIAQQHDAIQIAMKAFGLGGNDSAVELTGVANKQTALASVRLLEDAVIEHDARVLPDYNLIKSDVTGRASFEKNGKRLDVYTANKRPLEKVLGVDLIYVNLTHNNIVMVQYKMLEKQQKKNGFPDWIYRPDKQLKKELQRMKTFSSHQVASPKEYRLNSGVFYMKFVKRNGLIHNGGVILPLKHFKKVRKHKKSKGKRGGIRISYNALNGQYMRSGPFVNLISSGYIGSHVETTEHLTALIKAIVADGRSVVAAIESSQRISEEETADADGAFINS